MAQRVEAFRFSIPALTSQIKTPGASMADGIVDRIEVFFPPGVSGQLGLLIFYGAAQVVPLTAGYNLEGNNQTFSFDIEDYPTGQGWDVVVTNTDVIAHGFTVTFFITEIEPPPANPPVIVLLPTEFHG